VTDVPVSELPKSEQPTDARWEDSETISVRVDGVQDSYRLTASVFHATEVNDEQ